MGFIGDDMMQVGRVSSVKSQVFALLYRYISIMPHFCQPHMHILYLFARQPYSIFILFFALAYVCVSLDLTGMFAFIALHVARSSGKSGRRLFVYFFALNSMLTVFTSNDIVILTVTPIILYFCKHRNINPVPFLMSEFVAANCLSLLLYIGNPTNIIVASAYQLSFFSYSYWMAMPAIVAGVTGLAMTWLMFRKDVPRELEPIALSRDMIRRELKDRTSAIVGSTLLLSCLAALVITSFWFVPVWMVTLPFAVAMLVKDVVSDLRNARVRGTPIDHPMKQVVKAGAFSNAEEQQHDDTMEVRREESSENIVIVDNLDGKAATSNSLARGIDHMRTRLPTVAQAFDRMPWRVGPFVISMVG